MNVEIANNLVKLRKQFGLSQEELAEKIGVSRQAVSKWERSESSPDTDNLIALSKIYNITIDEMINSEANPFQNTTEHDENVKNRAEEKKRIDFGGFPIAILATIIYLALGLGFDLWHPGWLIFFIIPFFHVLVPNNRRKKNGDQVSGWRLLPYPILAFIIFMFIGFAFDGWAYSWLIFLTIPIWAYFVKISKH